MARPSMAGQRREEILDALEICILEQGIQATSLENIADTAKMKRTILRHYIGNRDDIICALSERWLKKYSQQWLDLLAWLPRENRADALIDSLFSSRSKEMVNNTIIGEAIFSEAKRLESIKVHQKQIMAEFIQHLVREFSEQFSKANSSTVELVAYGIYSNYLMSESLLPLGMFDEMYKLKQASLLMTQQLR
ncbi:TetR/AcrR family transcriptional regulator [Litorilituus lipolyticus]|uniref:TetR/AcrR family transcriptional regulator n=1 Tax=Litorilituus lipolyticus TaxID=2491017 RepID=A0A502L314_9GAMM|nr:TetR/AcrR family transcriptional regulator [Litorilituus lipolyticus]TPH18126.1 TetR/AcrR family transcriptional regulator [Litorilituus lipolyticus]